MLLEISNEYLEKEIQKIGAHPDSIPIFLRKSKIIPLKIFNIPSPAGNIIKQEMLAIGGDFIVHKNTVNCKVDKTDGIFLGTRKHYEILLNKIKNLNYFELNKVAEELDNFLHKEKVKEMSSPWGRKILFNRTLLMGIINVTPDSFYKGSRKTNEEEILNTAKDMVENGVDIIDIGGQSTRPGSDFIDLEEELRRVLPAIEIVRKEFPNIIISVDTFRGEVAEKAIEKGADIINDISGFSFDNKILKVVAETKAPYVLMHIKGTPKNMQENPFYEDVVKEIIEYFIEKIDFTSKNNVDVEKIIIDPGIGFGKRYEDNLEILIRLKEFQSLKKPILIGASRKSFIGKTLGDIPPEDRLEGTLAITSYCVINNVDIIRVHDVKENKRVIKMLEALKCQLPL
ncbi:MAG: dihydropteroate synthase [Dictyoglomus sp. NZ13-RE01]|nr:MAG: dihydropteroate synthase [Dictyoglomus sp. NZ13-RE01]